MVGEVAAGVVTRALWASLLGDVMATRPLRESEGTRSWLRDGVWGVFHYMANTLRSYSWGVDVVGACSPRPRGTVCTEGRCHVDKKFTVRTVKH